jgi:hypothetical protein
MMMEYSESPHRRITELEAIVGNILGRTGAPSRKQRENSTSLKEKVHEDVTAIVNWITTDEVRVFLDSFSELEDFASSERVSIHGTFT